MRREPSLKQRLSKAKLESLYHHSGLSTATIAERYGAKSPQILKLMEEYGIERRSRGAGKT
jgi:hypothetical protein